MVKQRLKDLPPLDTAKYGVVTLLAVKRLKSKKGDVRHPEHLSHTDIVNEMKPQQVFASHIIADEKGHGMVTNPFRSEKEMVERALLALEKEGLISKQDEHDGQHRFYTITQAGMKFYRSQVVGSHDLLRPEKDPLVELRKVKAALGKVLGKDDERVQQVLDRLTGNTNGRAQG